MNEQSHGIPQTDDDRAGLTKRLAELEEKLARGFDAADQRRMLDELLTAAEEAVARGDLTTFLAIWKAWSESLQILGDRELRERLLRERTGERTPWREAVARARGGAASDNG